MNSKKLKLALFFVISLALLCLPAHKANALIDNPEIGHLSPIAGSADAYTTPKKKSFTPWLAVGQGAYYGPYSYSKAYVPDPTDTNGNGNGKITFTIKVAPCSTLLSGTDPDVVYSVYRLNHDGDPIGGTNSNPTSQLIGESRKSDCGKSLKPVTIKINPIKDDGTVKDNGIDNKNAGDYGQVTFAVTAYLSQDSNCGHPNNTPNKTDCSSIEQSFSIGVDSDQGSSNTYIGLAEPILGSGCQPASLHGKYKCDYTDPRSYTGIYARNLQSSGLKPRATNWDWSLEFAPDCSILSGQVNTGGGARNGETQLILYDMDPGVYSQPSLSAVLANDSRTDTNYNWHGFDQKTGTITNPNEPYYGPKFESGSGHYDKFSFTPNIQKRYRIRFQDLNWQNTVQIYLPFDEFNAQGSAAEHCAAQLVKCQISPTDQTGDNSVQVGQDGQPETLTLWNKSSFNLPGSDILRQDSSDGHRSSQNFGTTFFAKQRRDFTFTISARGSPTTIDFSYSIVNSDGDLLSSLSDCSVSVRWKVPVTYTNPYFSVSNGDVFAGGWFDSNNTSCSSDDPNYQAPNLSDGVSRPYDGGILTFASGGRGSGTTTGAFALGLMENTPNNKYGFLPGLTGLTYSNQNPYSYPSFGGGYFSGSEPHTHCIPDYYTTKLNPDANTGTLDQNGNFPVSGLATGQYKIANPGALMDIAPQDQTIPPGRSITLFVNGDVYISHKIKYAPGYNASNVPKLAIIALGNIYIGPLASNLDGWYIAQPDLSSDQATKNTGVIWTCHPVDKNNPNAQADAAFVTNDCDSTLTVNGALTAKQFELLRDHGDLGGSPAEIINYTSANVIGPFFNPPAPTSAPQIDSLVSLPPVY